MHKKSSKIIKYIVILYKTYTDIVMLTFRNIPKFC